MSAVPVAVGERVRFRKTVGESDVYLFAGIAGDLAANHVDEEAMKASVYGRRIAHGGLLVGFVSTCSSLLIAEAPATPDATPVSLGYDRVRFLAPVFIGDTLALPHAISETDPARRRSRTKIEATSRHGT